MNEVGAGAFGNAEAIGPGLGGFPRMSYTGSSVSGNTLLLGSSVNRGNLLPTASVIMVEPIYRTHRCVQETPILWLGRSSDGGFRSRFHASTIVPGSMILTDAVNPLPQPGGVIGLVGNRVGSYYAL